MDNGDFFALYLRGGIIVYSFDLGGGAITVQSKERYDDGLVHNVSKQPMLLVLPSICYYIGYCG